MRNIGLGSEVLMDYEMCAPVLHGGAINTLDDYARKFIAYNCLLKGATELDM